MWMIFVLSSTAIGISIMAVLWLGNKIYLAMKRDKIKFENENRKDV